MTELEAIDTVRMLRAKAYALSEDAVLTDPEVAQLVELALLALGAAECVIDGDQDLADSHIDDLGYWLSRLKEKEATS